MEVKNLHKYKNYTLRNFKDIPQISKLPEEYIFAIEVVGQVLPFKVNNYVIDELIDWDNYENDAIFTLTFPRKEMLKPHHFERIANLLKKGASKEEIQNAANQIRFELNPHPAGQFKNIPKFNGKELKGIQHKYKETVLFFPSQGQTCHSYCSFCFRWPQFVGISELKFAMKEVELLIEYLKAHPEVTDVLFTGGDPLIMKTRILEHYIRPILEADLPHIKTIRIGTKALGFWPYRFLTDDDADDLLRLFEDIVKSGKHLAFMAHFNHPKELETEAVKKAVDRILNTGAVIRTQSPVLRNINDDSDIWASMWKKQVSMNMIPYYMFIARDTGAQHYFGVPLYRAYEIFKGAYKSVSGIARTVRGPSMSAEPGKIQVSGITQINGEKVFVLNFLQGRNPDWVMKPFFAKYDENAMWISDLKPAFSERFFFEEELEKILAGDR